MARLLVVDDEPNVLFSMEEGLRSDELDVITARTAKEGLEWVRRDRPDAAILDVRLPDMSGLDAFDRIRKVDPHLPVIIITAFATTETAIEAMKRGAFEYLLKPVDLRQLRDVVAKAIKQGRLAHVPALIADEEGPAEGAVDRIVGRSAAMQDVYKAIGRVAGQDVAVLILGESGTGKELVARAIYRHGRRGNAPFLAINCAAIPEPLLEGELFGHERGAFTGADRRRIGKFEQADGGTIFLDEIGDMTPATQAKMLRLLQDGRFERLGSNETIQTDVRIIAATHRDLEAMIGDGRFRPDLYYRLKVFPIVLPPLRERTEDLPLLVQHFIKRLNAEMGKRARSVSPEAMQLLEAYEWPGNVRELQAAVKYALVQASGDVLAPDDFPAQIREGGSPLHPVAEGERQALDVAQFVRSLLKEGEADLYAKVIAAVDRAVLGEVLRHERGNQVRASQVLGISRNTLRAKLRAAGLSVEKHLAPDSEHADP